MKALFTFKMSRAPYAALALACIFGALFLSLSDDGLAKLVALALGVVLLLTTAGRLRDCGRSGWWSLLLFIPIVCVLCVLALFFVPPMALAGPASEPR